VPAEQRGSVYGTKAGYGLQWRDENGVRRRRSGFATKKEARAWYRDVEAPRMRGDVVTRPPVTFKAHAEKFLTAHASMRDPNTVRALRERLQLPLAAFGDLNLTDLERRAGDIAAWRATLPKRSRYAYVAAFKQCIEAAVRWGDLTMNPVRAAGKNPPPAPRGVQTFTQAEVDAIAVELGPTYGPMIRFAAATGMRPEEYTASERGDIDRVARVARVARRQVRGRTKDGGKTAGSARELPLSAQALAALDDLPARLDTRLLFATPAGGPVRLDNFRKREWLPSQEAALGVCPHDKDHPMHREKGSSVMTCTAPGCDGTAQLKRLYDLRATFASRCLAPASACSSWPKSWARRCG
jgi:integrase